MAQRVEFKPGEIAAIYGCMFSGKTKELITDLKIAERIARLGCLAFKWHGDNRGEGLTVLRDKDENTFPAIPIRRPEEAFKHIKKNIRVVAFDEAQFFDGIVDVVKELAAGLYVVIVAGLPTDFKREGFGEMPNLVMLAQQQIRLTAVCNHVLPNSQICSAVATETMRVDDDGNPVRWDEPVVEVGETNYRARCIEHWSVLGLNDPRSHIL